MTAQPEHKKVNKIIYCIKMQKVQNVDNKMHKTYIKYGQ